LGTPAARKLSKKCAISIGFCASMVGATATVAVTLGTCSKSEATRVRASLPEAVKRLCTVQQVISGRDRIRRGYRFTLGINGRFGKGIIRLSNTARRPIHASFTTPHASCSLARASGSTALPPLQPRSENDGVGQNHQHADCSKWSSGDGQNDHSPNTCT
jgi:hypothetical protein